MPTVNLTPADSPYELLFAGKENITYSGHSADGIFVDPDNGGSACLFAGMVTPESITDLTENGSTGLLATIPTAGSGSNLSLVGNGAAVGMVASSGRNGDDGG